MAENQGAITILISSVGRRSQLVECFREAIADLGISGRILGIDTSPQTAPAAHLVDACYAVRPCTQAGFVDEVLSICHHQGVSLIVPTIDPELPVYAQHRQRFKHQGIVVAVSEPETIRIAGDKVETHQWLSSHGFPVPRQASLSDALRNPQGWTYPVIVKPRRGSASKGIRKLQSLRELLACETAEDDLVVQEFAPGQEYTVNLFVQNGHCVCAVPHLRLETRGGEVSKGITVRDRPLIEIASDLAEKLPGARDALNVQCFVDSGGAIRIIEINARFGGGFPLANRAGARFPRWILESILDRPSTVSSNWQDHLMMLRYDSAVFIHSPQLFKS